MRNHFWDFQIIPEKEEEYEEPVGDDFFLGLAKKKGYLARAMEKEKKEKMDGT